MQFLVALCLSLLILSSAHASKLSIYTENSPPGNFIDEQGKLRGLSVEIVELIQAKLHQSEPIALVPWARGYRIVKYTPNTMLFSTTRTPEREALFHWVGPLFSVTWVLVARKDSPLSIQSIEDAKKIPQIGTYRNDARENYLKKQGFSNLHSVNRSLQLPQLVLRKRLDAFVTTNIAMNNMLGDIESPDATFKILYELKRFPLYMAFSLQTQADTVQQWQRAFDKLQQEGKIQTIRNHWLSPQRSAISHSTRHFQSAINSHAT